VVSGHARGVIHDKDFFSSQVGCQINEVDIPMNGAREGLPAIGRSGDMVTGTTRAQLENSAALRKPLKRQTFLVCGFQK
jgi:hypothetical protein